jgi:hypothetical protein
MLVMDVCTRRLVGFGVEHANIDGVSVCRMFNRAIAGQRLPKHVSTDHDPLFGFYRWLANLRVLAIDEIKSVPYAPVSHPFIERLIGTVRREYLDHLFFWSDRPDAKVGSIRGLLQRASRTSLPSRHHAGTTRLCIFLTARACCSSPIRLGGALSRSVSHTDSSLSTNSPRTG